MFRACIMSDGPRLYSAFNTLYADGWDGSIDARSSPLWKECLTGAPWTCGPSTRTEADLAGLSEG